MLVAVTMSMCVCVCVCVCVGRGCERCLCLQSCVLLVKAQFGEVDSRRNMSIR